MIAASQRIVTVRAKAFSGEGVREHKCLVDGELVFVYDNVAQHFTGNHKLSPSAIGRIRKLAENQ